MNDPDKRLVSVPAALHDPEKLVGRVQVAYDKDPSRAASRPLSVEGTFPKGTQRHSVTREDTEREHGLDYENRSRKSHKPGLHQVDEQHEE